VQYFLTLSFAIVLIFPTRKVYNFM
jgi:hypothetical protein